MRENVTKIINYEKKEMIPLTYEENKSYEKQKVIYVIYVKINLILIKMMKMHLNYTIK